MYIDYLEETQMFDLFLDVLVCMFSHYRKGQIMLFQSCSKFFFSLHWMSVSNLPFYFKSQRNGRIPQRYTGEAQM